MFHPQRILRTIIAVFMTALATASYALPNLQIVAVAQVNDGDTTRVRTDVTIRNDGDQPVPSNTMIQAALSRTTSYDGTPSQQIGARIISPSTDLQPGQSVVVRITGTLTAGHEMCRPYLTVFADSLAQVTEISEADNYSNSVATSSAFLWWNGQNCPGATATPFPTATPSPTNTSPATASPTASPTITPTPFPTDTPSPTPTIGDPLTPDITPTPVVTPLPGFASISGRYVEDINRNNEINDGENGIWMGTVQLLDHNDNIIARAITDLYGRWTINDIWPLDGSGAIAEYKIRFNRIVPYWVFVGWSAGGDTDVIVTNGIWGYTDEFSVEAQIYTDLNALVYDSRIPVPTDTPTPSVTPTNQPTSTPGPSPTPYGIAAVSGFVFDDSLHLNGVREVDEPGVPNVQVSLLPLSGELLIGYDYTRFTNSNGAYAFSGLPAGVYQIQFDVPSGFTRTRHNVGVDDTRDSDADPTTGLTHVFQLVGNYLDGTIFQGIFDSRLLTPTPIETPTATPVPDDEIYPGILRDPEGQTVFEKQLATMSVEAFPDDIHYSWSFTDGNGVTWMVGEDSPILDISAIRNDVDGGPGVSLADQGAYQVEVYRWVDLGSGPIRLSQQSLMARLTVLERGLYDPANDATHVSNDMPGKMIPDGRSPVTIRMRNNGPTSWSFVQGYALQVTYDSCGMFQTLEHIPVPELGGVVVQPGEVWEFDANLQAPNALADCNIRLQMVELGVENFGDVVEKDIRVQWEMDVNGSQFDAWTFGNFGDSGPTSFTESNGVHTTGLGMGTLPTGENLCGWASPFQTIPLRDMAVYQLRFSVFTDQRGENAQPLISWTVFNHPGMTSGMEQVMLDGTGGANGIKHLISPLNDNDFARPFGREFHEMYYAPAAALLPSWRGTHGTIANNSAFAPRADTLNDMGVAMRYLDLDSAGVVAHEDWGRIALRRVRISAWDLTPLLPENILTSVTPNIPADMLVYNRPIHTTTHELGTFNEIASGPVPIEIIYNNDHNATVALGPNSSRSLFDWLDDTSLPLNRRLFPRNPWISNSLYIGLVKVVTPPGAGTNPRTGADVSAVQFHTPTVEVGSSNFAVQVPIGAPMEDAVIPRMDSEVQGAPQYLIGFFAGNNVTAFDRMVDPWVDNVRIQARIENIPQIRPDITSDTPMTIGGMYIIDAFGQQAGPVQVLGAADPVEVLE